MVNEQSCVFSSFQLLYVKSFVYLSKQWVGLDGPRNAHHRLLSTLLQDSDHSRRTIFCSKNYLEKDTFFSWQHFFNWWFFSEVRQNSVKCFFARRCVSGNCCPISLHSNPVALSWAPLAPLLLTKCQTKIGLKLNWMELIDSMQVCKNH